MKSIPKLNPRSKYLQVALNGTLASAKQVIFTLPRNERIIIEAGTPLIKKYGMAGVKSIRNWADLHFAGLSLGQTQTPHTTGLLEAFSIAKRAYTQAQTAASKHIRPYIVADMKVMDRGATEVAMAAHAGADAVVALGSAPVETLDAFIEECQRFGVDHMIDMMDVDFPIAVLRELKTPPTVTILHRGVDQTERNKQAMLPLHEIRRIKGNYDMMIAVAGGDTEKEIQSAIFNDADIVVIWKSVYKKASNTADLVEGFLRKIK